MSFAEELLLYKKLIKCRALVSVIEAAWECEWVGKPFNESANVASQLGNI